MCSTPIVVCVILVKVVFPGGKKMAGRAKARNEQDEQKNKLLWMSAVLLAAAIVIFVMIQSCEERPIDPSAVNTNGKQIPVIPRREPERDALAAYEADRNK